jgi:integrase
VKTVKGVYNDNDQLLLLATLVQHNPMMAIIFYIGVISGLRIGDILSLRVGVVKKEFNAFEKKTGKLKHIEFSDGGWHFISMYIDKFNIPFGELLFKTTRQTVYKYFKKAGKDLGLVDIGTHTMRKTYAFNVFRITQCIKQTRDALNHKYVATTVLYILGGCLWAIKRAFRGRTLANELYPSYPSKNVPEGPYNKI